MSSLETGFDGGGEAMMWCLKLETNTDKLRRGPSVRCGANVPRALNNNDLTAHGFNMAPLDVRIFHMQYRTALFLLSGVGTNPSSKERVGNQGPQR